MKPGTHKIDIDMPHIHARGTLKVVKNTLANEPAAFINPSISHILFKGIKSNGTTLKTMADHRHEIFINKLHQHLAHKRHNIRIYNALISKFERESGDANEYQMDILLLREFRLQEAEHFAILSECIKKLGADPGIQTSCSLDANVATATYIKIVIHPHTSIRQCIEIMLELESIDNRGWKSLIQLAETMGLNDMAEEFCFALRQDEIHLITLREWHEEFVMLQAVSF